MSLVIGSRIAHYDVTALIGEGGMGQVYRATDTKLNRQVALKILPEAFASDPDRLARFQREAQVLASLNHPGIAGIYGLEESGDTRALVLELVEGPTLADRITKGSIPLDEALPIAKQIAEALEAAHEAGVIHRDLKPANIKVRDDGTVKVLDFGLAKALDPTPEGDPSQSPTLTAVATQMGMIMGTAAYMSPEQARGKPVNKRADIWAFGCVLYEMLTGRRAFEGEDVSVTLANVINQSPDWKLLPTGISPALQVYLRRCLEQDPTRRVQAIGDMRLALDGLFETLTENAVDQAVVHQTGWRRTLGFTVATAALVGVIVGVAVWGSVRPEPAVVSRFTLVPPLGVEPEIPYLSRDGRVLAFSGVRDDGQRHVYLRQLDQLEAQPLAGTEGDTPLAFSPNGEVLLVRQSSVGRRLGPSMVRQVRLTGGPAVPVAEGNGASWSGDGSIVLSRGNDRGLWVATESGELRQLTQPAEGESHIYPHVLPNGSVLFQVFSGSIINPLAVYDPASGQRVDLVPGTTPAFLPTGHLVFWRAGSLWAAPFNPDRLELTRDPIPVVEGVATVMSGLAAAYAVSDTGTLVYRPSNVVAKSTLGWVNRQGEMIEPLLIEDQEIHHPILSPTGGRLAFVRQANDTSQDIWVRDLALGAETKLTEVGGTNAGPVWHPGGATITFGGDRGDGIQIYERSVDLSAETQVVLATQTLSAPSTWTPDGKTLVFLMFGPTGGRDIWQLSPGADATPFLTTEFDESVPRLSPDGHWLAYISDRTGEPRIVVQAFPQGGERFSVSAGPATEPVWSRTGKELFYRNGQQMWVVDVVTEPVFKAGTPRLLFEAPFDMDFLEVGFPNYDVSLDGQRFLMIRSDKAAVHPGYVVVEHWFEELKRLVPAP